MAYKKYSSKTTAQDKYSDLAKSVADIFIKALEEETLPWQRGFNPIFKHPPFNPASGTIYRGSNRMLLSLVAYQNGFKDPRFMTYNQAIELGGHVRKGEKSITCIKYGERKKAALDEEGKPKFDEEGKPLYEVKGYLSTFNVFNVEQIDGLNLPPITKESDVAIHNWSPIERAENLLVATGAKIENTSDCTIPCYNPSMDLIKLPLKEQYENKERYYATALHELSHWTGHKSRLDRDLDNSFGTDNYAKEELRAEIGSSLVCLSLGVNSEISENSKAYIKSWVQELKDAPNEILKACADADKICDYVMSYDPEYVKAKEDHAKPMIVEAKTIDKAELPQIKADVEKHIEKAVKNALETAPISLNDFFADFDKQQKNKDLSPTAKTPEEIKTEAKTKEENQFLSPEDLERNLANVMSKAQIISEWNNYFAKETIDGAREDNPFKDHYAKIRDELASIKEGDEPIIELTDIKIFNKTYTHEVQPQDFDAYIDNQKFDGVDFPMFTGFIEFTGKTKGEDFKFVTHGYGDFLKNQYDLEKSSDNVKAAFDKDNQPVNALGHFLHTIKSEDIDAFTIRYPAFDEEYRKFINNKEIDNEKQQILDDLKDKKGIMDSWNLYFNDLEEDKMHFNKNLAKDLMEHKGNSPLVNIENITLLDKEGKTVDNFRDFDKYTDLNIYKKGDGSIDFTFIEGLNSLKFDGTYNNEPFSIVTKSIGDSFKQDVDLEKSSDNVKLGFKESDPFSPISGLGEIAQILAREDGDASIASHARFTEAAKEFTERKLSELAYKETVIADLNSDERLGANPKVQSSYANIAIAQSNLKAGEKLFVIEDYSILDKKGKEVKNLKDFDAFTSLAKNSIIEDKSNIKALEFDGGLKVKGTFKGEKFTVVAKGSDNFKLNIDVAKSSANVFDPKKKAISDLAKFIANTDAKIFISKEIRSDYRAFFNKKARAKVIAKEMKKELKLNPELATNRKVNKQVSLDR